jgi:hypothetical protein
MLVCDLCLLNPAVLVVSGLSEVLEALGQILLSYLVQMHSRLRSLTQGQVHVGPITWEVLPQLKRYWRVCLKILMTVHSYDVKSGDEDSEDRPWRPSHAVFGKSTIKQSHIDNMRGRYFRDMSIVRVGGYNIVPAPKENEFIIYRSFLKAGLRFPLSKFVVEVLKIYQIFLHQITPKALIRMGIFVWAVRSQGLEPSAMCFYSMHALLYETKATDKEQYHNNFGCYGFIACPNASHPVPTFRKRWPGAWMEEWFYVKNDLKKREDIKKIIQRPIWSRFGLRRPKVNIDSDVEACQKAFSIVCAFIGTRDLIQEHISFRVWPLVESWDMPKETTAESNDSGLV